MTEKIYVELDENGFAKSSGWMIIYPYKESTKEFIGAFEAWMSEGGSLPAHSTTIKPKEKEPNKAYIFNGNGWDTVSDYRNTVVYDKQTRNQSTITELGDLQDTVTTLPPTSKYDFWDGEKWVKDEQAELDFFINQARLEKNKLLRMTDKYIERVQDMIDFDMSDDEKADKELIRNWKRYRVQLGKVDVTVMPVSWPKQPDYPYNGPI